MKSQLRAHAMVGITGNLTGRRVQPVPPICEPALAARAIAWAGSHRRRECFVGWPSVKAVVVNKLWPSLLDAYLARTGIAGQVTNEPRDPASLALLLLFAAFWLWYL